MSVSYWQDGSARETLTADVCIIGAGIAGLGTAYHLRRADANLRIVIVERGDVGSGASGRNAGFLLVGTADYYASDCERYGRDVARQLYAYSREN